MSSVEEERVKVLIVGAGPTGLGAATRLQQLGHSDWLLCDAFHEPGGLASTMVTEEGFHFDMGGHVIFSHYKYFDELLDTALGTGAKKWDVHERVSYVVTRGQRIPYPFQLNIRHLSTDDVMACISGLIQQRVESAKSGAKKPENFAEWMLSSFGQGIFDIFMRPYNFKVWAVPGELMSYRWIGERVATVDVERVIRNVIEHKDDVAWGPNATFRFPQHGGTGAIWKGVASLLPQDKQRYGCSLVALDHQQKVATFCTGARVRYDTLVSTIPVDLLCNMIGEPARAEGLVYSSTHVVGLGLRGEHALGDSCWMYFPDDTSPFYRTTVFSNYSPHLTPPAETELATLWLGDGTRVADGVKQPGPYWSLMMEVSESQYKPVNQETLVEECIAGALKTGLITSADQIVSVFHHRLERGYPTPSLHRDTALDTLLPWLLQHGIYSRGRFGAWRYEVANQDHSLMQGVEAASSIALDAKEYTVFEPGAVNTGKAPEVNQLHYLAQPTSE